MRSAVCLHGLSVGSNDKGDKVAYDQSFQTLKKNIIEPNNADVFLHTWNADQNSIRDLKQLYQPVSFICEEQKLFDITISKYHSTKSRWYSYMKSVELKTKHEEDNDFVYDAVMVARFDNCFLTPILFSKCDPNCFYSGEWVLPHSIMGFIDYWFFSNSAMMTEYSNLYHKIDEYLDSGQPLSSHVLSKWHFLQKFSEENLRYSGKEKVDWGLERQVL